MSVFELLCNNSLDEVKNIVFRDGKRKTYSPIRFLTREQKEKIMSEENNVVEKENENE